MSDPWGLGHKVPCILLAPLSGCLRGIHTYATRGEARQGEVRSAHHPRGEARRSSHRLAYVCMVLRVRMAWRRFKLIKRGVSCRDEHSLEFSVQWLAKKQDQVSSRLASLMCMVPLWTYCTIWQAMPRARHRLASPRLTYFDSLALTCTLVHRTALPRLTSSMCECPLLQYLFVVSWFFLHDTCVCWLSIIKEKKAIG